jgi:hypothetical protein
MWCSIVDMYWCFGATLSLRKVLDEDSVFLWMISTQSATFHCMTYQKMFKSTLLLFHSVTFVIVMTIKFVVSSLFYMVIVIWSNGFQVPQILLLLYGNWLYSSLADINVFQLIVLVCIVICLYHTEKCIEFILWHLVCSFAHNFYFLWHLCFALHIL